MRRFYTLSLALCYKIAATSAWTVPLKMTAQVGVRFVTNTKCPYAQRTWIALEESGTSYEMTEISLYGPGGKPDWFMRLNPKGEVPVLVVDGSPIVGSEETIDFLMQAELNPPQKREASSRWRAIINDRLKPVGKRAVLSGGKEADKVSLSAVLTDLEACLRTNAEGTGKDEDHGAFVCGNAFTAADVSAFPFLQRIHEDFGFPTECERLEAWYESARRRPGVRKTMKKDRWWWF